MKEGFYSYKDRVYYGFYNEEQVSGRMIISAVKPEYIKTDHTINDKDCAVLFCDNHGLLEPEYEDIKTILLTMKTFMNLNTEQAVDFSAVEEKLNIILPKELKLIYTAIHN